MRCVAAALISAVVGYGSWFRDYRQLALVVEAHSRYECVAGSLCPPFNNDRNVIAFAVYHWGRGDQNGRWGYTELDSRWASTVAKLFERKGGVVNFLNLGSNDLTEDIKHFEFLRPWVSRTRTIFVEPNPMMAEPMWQNLRSVGFDSTNSELIDVLMCTGASGNLTYYICSALPQEASVFEHHATANSVCKVPERVEEVQVQCLTVPDLLKRTGLDARDIDILHMDLEGLDYEILREFLLLEGFEPAVVVFEWHIAVVDVDGRARLHSLINLLAKRNYHVHQAGVDLIAMSSRIA